MPDVIQTGQEPAPATVQPEAQQEAQQFDATYVKALRAEAAEYRVKLREMETTTQKMQAERERQELEAKGNYQEALKKALDRAAQLEAQAANVGRYQETLTKYVEAERAGLPEYIADLLSKMDIVDQLDWLAKNKAVIKPPTEPQPTTTAGRAPFNPAGTKQSKSDAERLADLNRRRGQGLTPFG
jgi:hypothetical protein